MLSMQFPFALSLVEGRAVILHTLRDDLNRLNGRNGLNAPRSSDQIRQVFDFAPERAFAFHFPPVAVRLGVR
jgi:hypothetical protein